MSSSRSSWIVGSGIAAIIGAGIASCTLAGGVRDVVVPRQGWHERWGPLVPHETFPGDCGLCHTPEGWSPLREDFAFDHEAETGVPLEGVHAEAACLRCHNDRGPVSVYVARGCGGCHVDPHRGSLGGDCKACHDQRDWRPTGLITEHAATRLPLTGQHVTVPCERCHPRAAVGQFRGVPVECHLCHLQEAATVAFPDHPATGLTRDCERCHSTSGWMPADFDHTFPLIPPHDFPCASCHPGGTGTTFTCLPCHDQPEMDDKHEDVPGYVYDSDACLQCHPDGRE